MGAMVFPEDSVRWAPRTLLRALSAADRVALLRLGTRRVFQPGEALVHEGARDTDTFVLLDGCVKAVGNTVDGRAVLLSVRVAGELVGELAALDDSPRSASVIACTAVAARVVGQRDFLRYLAERPEAAEAIHAAVRRELRRATEHRLSVNGAPVARRVALVLSYLAEAYGQPGTEGVRIEVPLSQPELASLLGVSEPSVHRELAVLRTRGVILTGYRRLIVRDLAVLHALAT
jgi:CRP/FNR family cyclic AMP-dependent transcriptional regulator